MGLEDVRVLSRNEERLSPWVRLVSKEVLLRPDGKPERYHALAQPDYIAILARTRSGLIPLIRQYRPAVEEYTLELPAGLVEDGEEPEETCRRELKEEAGLEAERIVRLGSCFADTGRLENRFHAFFVEASDPDSGFVPEPEMEVEFVNVKTLREHILRGLFQQQMHLGVLAQASFMGVGWDRELEGSSGWLRLSTGWRT